MDVEHLALIRRGVSDFLAGCAARFDGPGRLLDVAPQDHEGAAPYFEAMAVETLDLDRSSGATYIADLCQTNETVIPPETFDIVVCTEVLEHTLDPFAAVRELRRVTKAGGRVLVTTPFNFRIHGPLPDCWRFTEHGLRALFAAFDIELLDEVATPARDLMPVQYHLVARRPID